MEDERRIELILKIQEEKLKRRGAVLRAFIPENPNAIPFEHQQKFLSDSALSKLMRCGNRAAKTFTACRDLAWKITRTHWYRQDWNVMDVSKVGWKNQIGTELYDARYLRSSKKVFWIVGPTYSFVNDVMWGQYLSNMIPEWFIKEIKRTSQGNIDKIIFRNGDILALKTYSQQETARMGFAVDCIYCDEMGTDAKDIRELIMRILDKNGEIVLGFTPLIDDPDFVQYIDGRCESGIMSLHTWSVTDNPLYRDDPVRMKRLLAEMEHLPEHERVARLSGNWYVMPKGDKVFEGVYPLQVEDFEVPHHWRRARVTDPASGITGHAEFAEDPDSGFWYCICSREFTWGEKAATADDIIKEIERLRPYPEFRYTLSIYDNAERWFGASAARYGYLPCIEKDRETAIITTRSHVVEGRVRFFRMGAQGVVNQLLMYHYNKDGSKIVKRKDHMLDCLMYFCRQMPRRLDGAGEKPMTEHQLIIQKHLADKEKSRVEFQKPRFKGIQQTRKLKTRGLR